MTRLRLAGALSAAIRQHGCETYPHECCGALLGIDDVVREVLPLPNTTSQGPRRRFLVGPDDYRRTERRAADSGLSLLGFYHSHPDCPPRPSPFDFDHAWPTWSYVIVTIRGGRAEEMASWRLRDDRTAFDEVLIESGFEMSRDAGTSTINDERANSEGRGPWPPEF